MTTSVFELDSYTVLANPTGVLNLPSVGSEHPSLRHVGGFVVFGPDGQPVAYRDDSAPRLRPDFQVWGDDLKQERLLFIEPLEPGSRRSYRVSAGEAVIGELQGPSKGGLLARPWQLQGPGGEELAQLKDTSFGQRLRRGLGRAKHESLRIDASDSEPPVFLLRQEDPVRYMLRVMIPEDCKLDRRMILASALVVPAVEGFTDYLAGDTR